MLVGGGFGVMGVIYVNEAPSVRVRMISALL
jgi:hypothetical protein